MDMKLEVVPLPVRDVDAAKDFYSNRVGFTVDHDVSPNLEKLLNQMKGDGSKQKRIMELNPNHEIILKMRDRAEDAMIDDFAELLLLEKLGPRTLQSLALVAEVVHGAPSRFNDPARFSFAHGGKDGHPFKVPLKTYDESLNLLRNALDRAKAGNGAIDKEKLDGFRRLDRFVRAVEARLDPCADFDAAIAHEKAISHSLNGRSVLDDKLGERFRVKRGQLSLF